MDTWRFIHMPHALFVQLLPARLVYWCIVWAAAYATTGKYSDTVLPELTVVDLVKRWEDKL